jgi:hypothetical protein
MRRSAPRSVFLLLLLPGFAGCRGGGAVPGPTSGAAARTYEMGWSVVPPRATQAAFFRRYETLLDGVGTCLWVIPVFADLSMPSLGLPPGRAAGLAPFAYMGMVDSDLNPKPAYDVWKAIDQRPRTP